MKNTILFILLPIFSFGSNPVSIPAAIDSFLDLSASLYLLADPDRQMGIGEARESWEDGAFVPAGQMEWGSYYVRGKSAYWARIEIANRTGGDLNAVLVLFAGDTITLYEEGATARHCGWAYCTDPMQSALSTPEKQRFYLQWGPGETKVLYLRMCGHLGFTAGVRTLLAGPEWQARNWYARKAPFYIVSGLVIGFIGFIFVYAILQWIQTRDKIYGYYAGYLTGFLLLLGRALSTEFWDTSNPFYWQGYFSYILTIWLLYGSYVLFLDAFTNARVTFPALHRFFRLTFGAVMGLYTLSACVYWIDHHWGWYLTLFTKVMCQVTGLGLLVVFWRQASPIYSYLAWGMGALVLGALLSIIIDWTPLALTMRNAGLSTDLFGQAGVLIELLFFTLGLAYRSRLAIREREQARAEAQRLRLERALETERLRTQIAQDIHDEVGGRLTRMALSSELSQRLPGLSAEDLKGRLAEIGSGIRAVSRALREVIFAINPDFDRFSEMQAYMRETAREFFKDTEVALEFDFPEPARDPALSPVFKRQILFLYKEALQNIAKHAEASRVWISFSLPVPGRFRLEVRDNGRGFEVSRVPVNGYNHGLSGIRKRAQGIGAEAGIYSRLGEGARVEVEGEISY
ncbi:MAG: 7TM diverse intracellular signaling domain-containing protein [Saprospiraceae bacterium]